MSERDPIAELLSADEETFWRLVAEMRMSGPETRKASPLLLAGTESEVRKKRKVQQDVRQKSQPLIEEMRERGPSHEERYAMSCDSLLLCVEGTRSRFSVPVSGYDSRAIVAYATKAIYLTDWKRLVEAVAGAISSLAEIGLVRLDAEDCRVICELLSPPPDAFASPQNARSRGRSIYEVRHDQGDMPEIKLDDLKSKLKLLADRLSVDPELASILLQECPRECQVLRDRLSDPAMIQYDSSLEDATLPAGVPSELEFGNRLQNIRTAASTRLAESEEAGNPAASPGEVGNSESHASEKFTLQEADRKYEAEKYAATKARVFGAAEPSVQGLQIYLDGLHAAAESGDAVEKSTICKTINFWKEQLGVEFKYALDSRKVQANTVVCTLSFKPDAGNGAYRLRSVGRDQPDIYSRVRFPQLIVRSAEV